MKILSPTLEFDNGLRLLARLVRPGDRYGADMRLVSDSATIEFYDTRYPFCYAFVGTKEQAQEAGADVLGQLISRYNTSALMNVLSGGGLNLHGGVPAWRLSSDAFRQVIQWIRTEMDERESVQE